MVKQKDISNLHGVFKSSVRILFEVLEATMMNWSCPPSEEGGSQNIYVEVRLDVKSKVVSLCQCLKAKKSAKGKALRGRTPTIAEQQDTLRQMRWKKVNEDQSTMALFRLGHHKLKVSEGDPVNLIAEVYRSRGTDGNGTKVAVMQGAFKAGALGQVTLFNTERPTEDREDELEKIPHLVLELRPTFSSSFSLEHAQPRSKEETIEGIRAELALQKNCFRRMNVQRRLSAMMNNTTRRISFGGSEGPPDSSMTKTVSIHDHKVQAASSMNPSSNMSSRPSQRHLLQPWALQASDGSSNSEAFVSRRDSDRSDKRHHVARTSKRLSSSSAGHVFESRQPRQLRSSGYDDSGGSSRGSETYNPLYESSVAYNASEKQRSRFGLLKALFKKNPQLELRHYDTWTVTDWPATWKSPWPVESDDLKCKYDVVQLMQEEFRRDCVLFFNTLFPIFFASCSKKSEGFGPLNQSFLSIREVALSRSTKTKIKRPPPPEKSFGVQSVLSLPASKSKQMLQALMPAKELDDVDGEVDGEVEVEVVSTIRFRCAPTSRSNYPHSEKKFRKMFSERPAYRRYLLGPEPDANGYCPKGEGTSELLMSLLDDYSPRIWFLKRLYICFAVCGLYYNEIGNSAQLGDLWPYPLASALGHGSRILIRLEEADDRIPGSAETPVLATRFLNFLLTGDVEKVKWKIKDDPPFPLKARAAATHACLVEKDTGHVLEKKLQVSNVADTFQNLLDGIGKKHLGMNVPMGGVGHEAPMGEGYILGFSGKIFHDLSGVTEKRRFEGASCCGLLGSRSKKNPPYQRSDSICSAQTVAAAPTLQPKVLSPASSGSEEDGNFGAEDSLKTKQSTNYTNTEMYEDKQRLNWRSVPKRQSGHMYIRIDDFGSKLFRHCGDDSIKQNKPRNKLEKNRSWALHVLERAIMRRTIISWRWLPGENPGEIFFPSSMPVLPRDPPEHTAGGGHHGSEGDFPKLLRVSSEPSLQTFTGVDASEDDVLWVKRILHTGKAEGKNQGIVYLQPPSIGAMHLLLHHYNPLGTHLFGTSNFKSVKDLYNEVTAQTSCIFIDKNNALQRFVECVVLQLKFRGRLLMLTHERIDGEGTKLKNIFISTQIAEEEDWKTALKEVLMEKLGLDMKKLEEALEGKNSHTVIQEAMCSPSYPGLMCHYRTHMVQWSISEECDLEFFKKWGLPVRPEARKDKPFNCDFQTTLRSDKRHRRNAERSGNLYWAWVPEVEARKLQIWVNLGEANVDERWARHAFQREGAVQFPPTENSLTILLQRCGIDMSRFGSGSRSLNALWRELTNQEGVLHMQGGQPLLAVETVMVLVRWKRKEENDYHVLVQLCEEHPDGRVNDSQKLLGARKSKEMSWSNAAIRCMMERLRLTRQQVTAILGHKPDDASRYTFVEERKSHDFVEGIDMLHRTHLVTYTLKEDVHKSFIGQRVLGISKPNVNVAAASVSVSLPSSEDEDEDDDIPTAGDVEVTVETPYGDRKVTYTWVFECDELEKQIEGMSLFASEKIRDLMNEPRKLSSVLLGLEGADPGNVSAFGCGHSADGQSSKVSAVGGRKWRAFRTNNAPQIPADIGGMRIKISEEMFEELVETCQKLDLLDPGLDLLWEPFESYPRELLNHKYAEKELFKLVLGGSCQQAKQAIEQMKEYRAKHQTLAQVHHCLQKVKPKVKKKHNTERLAALDTTRMYREREGSLHSLSSSYGGNSPGRQQGETRMFQLLPKDLGQEPLLPCEPKSACPFGPSVPPKSEECSVPAGKILPHHPLLTPYIAPSYRKARE